MKNAIKLIAVLLLTITVATVALGYQVQTAWASVVEVTDGYFETEVLQADVPVLVDFCATWCGPCRQLEPVLDQISEEYEGKLTVAKLNIEDNPDVSNAYSRIVRSTPTLLLFKDGKVEAEQVGYISKGKLKDLLDRNL